jgi:tetratricopeptide (TPR) repeat protein
MLIGAVWWLIPKANKDMRDKVSDKLPIFVCFDSQCKLMLMVSALLLLSACATAPSDSDSRPPPGQVGGAAQAEAEAEAEVPATTADAELDSELLFHVLAAERLAAVGDFEEALANYLAAARLSDDPDLARQVISMAMRLQDWSAMAEGAQRWRELAPADMAPIQYGVLARINLGQIDEAADWLTEMIEGAEGEAEAWRDAMVLLGAADQDDQALATLDALVERLGAAAERPQVLASRSFLLWQLGRADQALALAIQAVEAGGERDQYVWAAQLAAAESDLDLALDLYRRARIMAPEDRGLGLAEAEVLRQMDRHGDAIELLQSMRPDSEVLYTLGSYLYQAERLEEASDVWDRLAAVESADDPMHHAFLVAFLAELLDKHEQALSWYEQVESGPNENRALLRRGIVEAQRGSLLSARSLFQSVRLGDDPRLRSESYLIEADILREAGLADQAVRLLTGALREQPGNVAMLYTRAICAVAMDDIELAEQDFRRILQIEDDNAMALNALGYTLTDRTDRHQEAYRLIRRALELEPESAPILDSMGWVYFRMGQPEQALPYLERALAGEDNPEIAAHLGEVLLALGREAEAREVLEQALERFPDDAYLGDTLARLGLRE